MLWQEVWMKGIYPQFNEEQKRAFKHALETNSKSIIQSNTALDAKGRCKPKNIARRCCPIAFVGLSSSARVDEVLKTFARTCRKADELLLDGNEDSGCVPNWKDFVEWWDKTPRQDAIKQLLELINSGG